MPAARRNPSPPRDRPQAQAAGRLLSRRPWTFEVMLFALALVVYQVSRAVVIGDPTRAVAHAWDIINWEKASGLFFENGVQRFVLEHLALAKVLNYFYLYGHYTITPIFFIWLYRRRHHAYTFIRNGFFAANAIALVVFIVFPVAPPRLVRGSGFVDTLNKISGIDLHAGRLSGWFNPFAAVPSMHFGYALMIGIALFVLLRGWAFRVVVLAYPAVVFLTIVGTANHYVVDAIAGAVVMAMGFVLAVVWGRVRSGRNRAGAIPLSG